MRKHFFITLLIVFTFIISACGAKEITYTPPPIEDDWSVRMIQTGGIAGVNRAIEVLSDGSYTVYQQAGVEGIKGQLTEAELNQLSNLVTNLEIKSSQSNSMCADCFEYNIEIQSGAGTKLIFELDDLTLPDSGAGELVSFLQKLFG